MKTDRELLELAAKGTSVHKTNTIYVAMKTDRELLELAAKAAGYVWSKSMEVERQKIGVLGLWLMPTDGSLGSTGWNPLTDDGDAFRLVVKLRLGIVWWKNGVSVEIERAGLGEVQVLGGDAGAATRRAIVLAAAAIGELMS